MKKSFKLFLVFIIISVITSTLIFSAVAATILHIDGYIIKVEENGYTSLSGWEGSGILNVPNSLNNYYISEIENLAFSDNALITGLVLNNAMTLKRIGAMAFMGCTELSGEVVIPNRVTTIGMGAFQDCPKITECTLHSGSKSIPEQMFYNCTALETATINYGFQTIGKLAFGSCGNLESVTIPSTVSFIDNYAFNNCPKLTIHCFANSYAHQYAEEKGINYVLIDAPAPTEPPTEEPTTAPTEAPTLEPTEFPTEPILPILGDTDGNGVIEVDDATYIQRVIAELPVPYPMETIMYGDVDGDGELTITDATLIQRYVAEMPVNYPIGEPIAK